MTLEELERNPKFRELTWEQQKLMRYDLMLEAAGGLEALNSWDPRARAELVSEVLSREPVFENRDAGDNYLSILQKAKSQNKQEREEATRQIKQIAGTSAIGSSGIFKTMMNAVGGLAQQIAGVKPGEEMTWEALYGKDARKMVEYSRELLQPGDQRIVDNLTRWGGIAAMGLDFLAARAITGGLPSKLLSSPFRNFAETQAKTRLGMWLSGSVAPMVIENTAGGVVGVVREQLLRDPGQQVRIKNILQDFGEYAALDYVIGLALSGVGIGMKAAWKTFRGVDKGLDKLTPAVKEQKLQAFLRGELDISTFGELSEATQDRLIHARNVQKFAADPSVLGTDSIAQTTVMAHNSGQFMRQLDDGTFRLRSMADTRASKIYNDLFQVKKALAAQIDRVTEKMSPADAMTYMGSLAPFRGYVDSYAFHRKAYDGVGSTQAYRNTISPGEFSADYRKFQELKRQGRVQMVDTFKVAPDDLKQTVLPLVKAEADALNNGLVIFRKIADPKVFAETVAAVKKVGGELSEEAEVWAKLAAEGYDGAVMPNGQLVHLFPETIRIQGAVNPMTGKPGQMKVNFKQAEVFDQTARVSLREDIAELTPKQFSKSPDLVADSILEIGPGPVQPSKVQTVVEGLLAGERRGKVPKVQVQVDDSLEALKSQRVRIIETPTEVRVLVPSEIPGPESFRVFAKNLLEAVERRTTRSLRQIFEGGFPQTRARGKALENTLNVLPNANPDVQLQWIKQVAKHAGADVQRMPGGKYSVAVKGGGSRIYKSLDDLAKSMYFQAMTKESLGVQLAQAGYRMVEEKGRLVVYGKQLGKKWEGATPEELLTAMGWSPRRLNARYGPKTVVENGKVELRLEEDVVLGSGMQLRSYLDSFQDFIDAETNRIAHRSARGVIAQVGSGVYQVEMPRFGIVEGFTSIGEARRFMERDWATFENLQKAASRRGWSLVMEEGQWALRGPEINVRVKTAEEIGEALKMSPDPVWAPPVLGDEIEGSVSVFVKDHPLPVGFEITRPRFLTAPEAINVTVPGPSLKTSVAYATAPMRDFVRLASEDLGNVDNWLKAARVDELPLSKEKIKGLKAWAAQTDELAQADVQKAYGLTDEELELVTWVKKAAEDKTLYRLSKTLSRQASLALAETGKGNAHFNNILTPGGKLIPTEKRKGMFYFMQAKTDAARLAVAEKFRLGTADLEAVEEIRRVLGRNKYEGLFAKFGIDPNLFLFDYMPRIRRHLDSMKPSEINKLGMDEFMERVFGKGNVPKELSFFAEHQRLMDVANYAMDDDILSVLHKYNTIGHKKLYLNDIWRETYEYLDSDVGKKLPVAVHQRMNRYRQQIMGTYSSDAELMVQDAVTRFMKKHGKDGIDAINAGQSFFGRIMSLNYLTTMGWRPWLPLRNLFQVYSTLAPRFGNSATNRAIKEIVADADGEIIQVMKNLGIIQDVPPIVHQLAAEQSRLGKLTAGGLKWYKNSDDLTRAVAFKTAWNQWSAATARLKSGALKGKDEFLEFTQANLLGPDTANMIWDLVQKGKMDEARNLFGFEVTADTMFLYQRAESPMMFQGLVGKMFGQYGTYSANFRQNVWKGLRYGTLKQKAAFVARFAFNSAALYGAFKALGIQEKNFLPWSPIGFSGGPLFNAGITALQATQDNYRGRQARAELQYSLSQFIPGSYQYRTLKEFLDETEKGNSYRAFLALLDLPLASE